MDFLKQELFVKRILFLHDVATRRAGKACSVRLPLAEWLTECDRMCFVSHVLSAMAHLKDAHGNYVFDNPIIESLLKRAVEGNLDLSGFGSFRVGRSN